MRPSTTFWLAVAGLLVASRLAHLTVLWADEDYHLAAAIQLLHGKMLYRDLWYDKPPLGALWALVWGGFPGWPLRLVSTLTALAACWLAFRFAASLWTTAEGFAAAGLLAFYQVFYFAHATIPVEPDTLLLLPHLAAVYWAWRRRPFAAGVMAGLAFLLTPKGGFVLAACLLFEPAGWLAMAAGFLLPNAACVAWLVAEGAWSDYIQQVWRWGLQYAGSPPDESPATPLVRLLGWLGFHAVLVIGAAWTWWRPHVLPETRDAAGRAATAGSGPPTVRLLLWLAISLAGAAIGWRLLPRYLNQLLPPLAILAAPGIVQVWDATRNVRRGSRLAYAAAAAIAIAALVPIVRFGPRYSRLITDDAFAGGKHTWVDVQMDQESRRAAALVEHIAQPGDTIFIWGYRPNIVVYTRLPVASRFWESQPLTGVPADRHLSDSQPIDPAWAARNRRQVVQSAPDIIVDGLSRYNPGLDIHTFPELAEWMRHYCPAGGDHGIAVYRRCALP